MRNVNLSRVIHGMKPFVARPSVMYYRFGTCCSLWKKKSVLFGAYGECVSICVAWHIAIQIKNAPFSTLCFATSFSPLSRCWNGWHSICGSSNALNWNSIERTNEEEIQNRRIMFNCLLPAVCVSLCVRNAKSPPKRRYCRYSYFSLFYPLRILCTIVSVVLRRIHAAPTTAAAT